jgi:2-polyprenyl-3-methyl-5-hydroxy-6-metoxy-1,4-benzoquinol methylase
VGSLAIPLATKGAIVKASDISNAMATEAQRRADSLQLKGSASFSTADLESLTGENSN